MDELRPRIERTLSGSYTIERELGGGGMSRTYLAREHSLSRRVVIKVLSPDLMQGISIERFKREVLLAAGLQHPHMVPVLSTGDAEGVPWFTMPYVDGESLRARLEHGRLGIGETIAILRDVAKALSYAHAHGVVHRDIKPDNVLLSAGSATVTDFGIAKAISASRTDPGSATLTQAGMAIGTPAYMAPEQAAGDRDLDHRADLYAFGAMAYEMLAGQHVFPGLTPARALVAHLSETPRDLRALRSDVPPVLSDLIMRCLAKDPAARPQDASVMVRVLDTIGTSGAAPVAPAVLLGPRQTLRRALLTWTALTAAVALIAWAANETVGLPDWALTGAIGVMLAGLPGIGLTWWVQRVARRHVMATPSLTPGGTPAALGPMATFAMKASPHVSWTRTWRAGAVVVGVFALLVSTYMVTRAMGIGPAASLMGSGEFSSTEKIVVADFRPPANDSLLGATVAEALRTDLGQSDNLRVMSRAAVREVLQRMQRPTETQVLFPVAREIATREGAKALIDGEVVRVGGAYVLSARLVAALNGEELATFRETAANDAELIGKIGTLARTIRERVGESLKHVRSSSPLERVSTASLPALRRYVEGLRLEERGGDPNVFIAAFRETVALDSTFAMAWRKLATALRNNRASEEEVSRTLATAWRFRDRLTEEERALLEGAYYSFGPEPDAIRAVAAYEQLIARDSMNAAAMNGAATIHVRYGRFARAESLYRQMARTPAASGALLSNAARLYMNVSKPAAAESILQSHREKFPGSTNEWELAYAAFMAAAQSDSAEALLRRIADARKTRRAEDVSLRYLQYQMLGDGRIGAAHAALERAIAASVRAAAPEDVPATMAFERVGSLLDSATVAGVITGDTERAKSYLKRAMNDSGHRYLTGSENRWEEAAFTGALVGDEASGRLALSLLGQKALARDPDHVVSNARLEAYGKLATGDLDGALGAVRRALALLGEPGPEIPMTAAMAHERAGRIDSAIVWYEIAARSPTAYYDSPHIARPAAHRRLAELYDKQGNLAKAIEHYEWIANAWKRADASLQPVVQSARARAAELRVRNSPG